MTAFFKATCSADYGDLSNLQSKYSNPANHTFLYSTLLKEKYILQDNEISETAEEDYGICVFFPGYKIVTLSFE